jgi:hypothetical protein
MIRPWRSPIDLPDKVKDYVMGKTFCEIGCGEGDLLKVFDKYASKSYGIEVNEKYFPALDKIDKSITIFKGSALAMEIPKCQVYFCWIRPRVDTPILRILPPCTFITYKMLKNKSWMENEFAKYDGSVEYIDFVSKEEVDHPDIKTDTPLVIGILHKK